MGRVVGPAESKSVGRILDHQVYVTDVDVTNRHSFVFMERRRIVKKGSPVCVPEFLAQYATARHTRSDNSSTRLMCLLLYSTFPFPVCSLTSILCTSDGSKVESHSSPHVNTQVRGLPTPSCAVRSNLMTTSSALRWWSVRLRRTLFEMRTPVIVCNNWAVAAPYYSVRKCIFYCHC